MYRIGAEEIAAVSRLIETKQLFKINDGTQEVLQFEREWKEKTGTPYAICMTSGMAALISGLVGMGIGAGDEVIVPAYTYIASANAILAVGAIPVIADVDETLTLDPVDVEQRITDRTRAIMPVHIMGFPCNMDAICALAKKHNLLVIEDACQSVGGCYHGKHLGTIGDVGAYSFNYYKVISAGEGGMLATNNKSYFEKALIYHDSSAIAFFGQQIDNPEDVVFTGTEYRANEIMGAIMRVQLKRLDGILHDLKTNRQLLIDAIADTHLRQLPSNDSEGEVATVLALSFDCAAQAEIFAGEMRVTMPATIPINTGKHIFTHWTSVQEKRGGADARSNAYLRPENADRDYNYAPETCPNTLDYLAKTVYLAINPDWTEAERREVIDTMHKAAAACK